MPDHPPLIDDVVKRCAGAVPPGVDGVPAREGPPVQLLLVHDDLDLLYVGHVGVYADQREGLVRGLLDVRPSVGPTGPSLQSALRPEVQQQDLAAIVAQLERPAALVRAFDLLRLCPDRRVAELVRVLLRPLTDRISVGYLYVAVLSGGPLEERLRLP